MTRLLVLAAVLLAGCAPADKDPLGQFIQARTPATRTEAPPSHYTAKSLPDAGVEIVIDHATGCQYLLTRERHLTPRLNERTHPMCKETQ